MLAMIIVGAFHNLGVFRAGLSMAEFHETLTAEEKVAAYLTAENAAYIPSYFFFVLVVTLVLADFLTTMPKWLDIEHESDAD